MQSSIRWTKGPLVTLTWILVVAASATGQTRVEGIGQVSEIRVISGEFKDLGPVTASPLGHVYFVDNGTRTLHRLIPEGTRLTSTAGTIAEADKLETILPLPSRCAALAFDPRGKVIAVLRESKQIVAVDLETKQTTVVVEHVGGNKLRQPTGIALDQDGTLFFADADAGKVYRLPAGAKAPTEIITGIPDPQDVLISPNGNRLLVTLRNSPLVMAYGLSEEGASQGEVFCTLRKPDELGFKGCSGAVLDLTGNLFLCTRTGVQVFDPNGRYLATIETPAEPRQCTFGGPRRAVLFFTTEQRLHAAPIIVPFDPYPLVLLGIGIFCIFAFIIYLRLHAFLALILAALIVGSLSPRILLGTTAGISAPTFQILNVPLQTAQAFGDLMGRIGLPIAFATIIGKAMMDSGAADRIVRFFTRLFGERMAPLALLASGFVLSIPVFFDNVFLLLVPLARALYVRTKKNYLLYVTAIGAGGAVTHSLVPPTPGPIVMSETLGVDLGYTILVGIMVGIPVALVGFGYAAFINRKMPIELRASGSVSIEELERQAAVEERELPALWLSLTPILLPVIFITSRTVFGALERSNPGLNAPWILGGVAIQPTSMLDFLGNPNIALLVAAIISMLMVFFRKGMTRTELGRFTADALNDAGMILLITSAGGAFGRMLTNVGVGESLGALSHQYEIPVLVLAWGLAVLFKIAQGSGTVAMITAAGIIFGILKAELESRYPGQAVSASLMAEHLGYHPVYLIMAIGCGSKIASWMNDSGFWVVSKMGGLTEPETIKSWTMTLVSMGIVGLGIVWLFTILLPLV